MRPDVRQHVDRRLSGREAALVRDLRDLCGDVGGDLADSRQRRIQAALVEVGLAHEEREGVRGAHEHLVRDPLRAARDHAEPNPREDVGVVPLARH